MRNFQVYKRTSTNPIKGTVSEFITKIEKLRFTLLLVFCLASQLLIAQNGARLTFYQFSQELFNPALTGAHSEIKINSFYRRHWAKIPGSPKTAGAGIAFPISLNAGAGISVIADHITNTANNCIALDGSYRIPLGLDKGGVLSFGLKLGFNFTDFSPTGDQLNDPLYSASSDFSFQPGFGIFYFDQVFFAGISIPAFSSSSINEFSNNSQYNANVLHLNTGLNVRLSPSVSLRPSILIRTSRQFPTTLEGNTMIVFNDRFFIGAGMRKEVGPQALIGFKIDKRLEFNYAFDFGTKRSDLNSGVSHEIHLIYTVVKSKNLAFKSKTCFGGKWKNHVYDQPR